MGHCSSSVNKESDFFSKFSDLNINIPNEKVPLSNHLKIPITGDSFLQRQVEKK